jgi:hypothetical protein
MNFKVTVIDNGNKNKLTRTVFTQRLTQVLIIKIKI